MTTLLFDIETDGLLDELTQIHSLVIKDAETGEVWSCCPKGPTTDDPVYHSILFGLEKLQEADLIIGHNIIKFDIPAIKKLYPWFSPKGQVRDTLVMSYLAYSDMRDADFSMRRRLQKKGAEWIPGKLIGRHSLEAWGYRLGEWKGDYSQIKVAEAKEAGIPKDQIVSYVWGTWSQDMQDYCVQDVEVTDKLWQKLCAKFKEWGIDPLDFNPKAGVDCVQLEHDVAEIMWRQEQYGFLFDEEKAAKLYATLSNRRQEIEEELQKVFKPWWRNRGRQVPAATRSVKRSDLDFVVTKRRFGKNGRELKPYVGPVKEHYTEGVPYTKVSLEPFNPGSRQEAANRLMKLRGWKPTELTEGGEPKVSEETLKDLPFPEAKLLAEYFMVQKRLGQLSEGNKSWLKNVRRDGRIPAGVKSNGAVTGRMTHYGVANVPGIYDKKTGEKLPYGKECRELFIAADGKVIVGCDADSLELRCLAGYMARYDDGAYIKAVTEGKKEDGTDNHTMNAKALGGIFRETAKTWFYAFIYGAWFEKLGSVLGATGSRNAIIKVGKETQKKFLDRMPALKKIIKAVQRRAKKRGWIKGLDGRRIPVRKLNAALNTLLQSAGAVFMKRALVLLDRRLQGWGYTPGQQYEFVANIHDEFQIEADEEKAEEIKETAEWAIMMAGKFYDFACPLAGSGDIGRDWSATH